MSVSDKKSELRSELLKKRLSFSNEEWSLKSIAIIEQLKKLPEFKTSTSIHIFVSMNYRKEVNTHDLIKELLSSDKKVIVPITDFKTVELRHSELLSFNELSINKWGVLEPSLSRNYKGSIGIIIVPLLAGDTEFNRLGYGKGFYDRFLKSSNALKIGLLFSDFLLDEIPVDERDEKLDIIITEKDILKRNNRKYLS